MEEKKPKKKNIEEEQLLVRRILNSEEAAKNEFVKEYSKLIYSCIYRTLKRKGYSLEEDIIDDLFQEVFLNFWKDNCAKLRKFKWKNDCSLATWISLIATRLVVDYIRKEGPKRALTQSVNEPDKKESDRELIDTVVDDSAFISRIINKKENLRILEEAFRKLPKSDQIFLELWINQELPDEEIAKKMNKKVSAIHMQRKRVIEKLKGIIEKLS